MLLAFAAGTFDPVLCMVDFKFVNENAGNFDISKSAHLQFFVTQLMKHMFNRNENFGLPLTPNIMHIEKTTSPQNGFKLITVASEALLDIVKSTKEEPIVVESLMASQPAKLVAEKISEFKLIT